MATAPRHPSEPPIGFQFTHEGWLYTYQGCSNDCTHTFERSDGVIMISMDLESALTEAWDEAQAMGEV